MRGLRLLLAAIAAALLAAPAAPARLALPGRVTHVVDGDTVDVRLASGKRERVRLIGIDTPELAPRQCYATAAKAAAIRLAGGARVTLHGDPTQDVRDRYGRLLAYVELAGRGDLGRALLAGGFARVYVYDRAFRRLAAYRAAERAAHAASRGLWSACGAPGDDSAPPPAPPPAAGAGGRCAPGYSPCLPVVADLDCADVRDLAPIRVTGRDPYRLDGDGDGVACE